ncbi:MAG: glycosyltransferase family A protein [Candidatus Andersenbacteria bacterium]
MSKKLAPKVSVLLPTKNAGPLFEHVLRALEQQRGVNFEVLIVDSGSSDGTVERINAFAERVQKSVQPFDVRLMHIKASEFGHGKTRNYMAQQARGELLVLITHDASPMTPQWLAHITAPFANPNVGIVFGPQAPRPDGNPVIRAELLAFFAGFAEKNTNGRGRATTYATKPGPGVDRAGQPNDELMRFSSDVNAAIRRSAWEECNFRDVTYCEDQLIARDLLEAGWFKVYEPRAAVYHSHNFGTLEFFRRYTDEWQGMYRAFGYIDVKRFWHLPGRVLRASLATRHALASDPRLSWVQKTLWYPRAAALATMRQLGGYVGPRLERLPHWLQKRVSREYHLINA